MCEYISVVVVENFFLHFNFLCFSFITDDDDSICFVLFFLFFFYISGVWMYVKCEKCL